MRPIDSREDTSSAHFELPSALVCPLRPDIDFGHFLGNFKKKFGFNRERSAFVFTPEMAFVRFDTASLTNGSCLTR
jgi:hypothetical protein